MNCRMETPLSADLLLEVKGLGMSAWLGLWMATPYVFLAKCFVLRCAICLALVYIYWTYFRLSFLFIWIRVGIDKHLSFKIHIELCYRLRHQALSAWSALILPVEATVFCILSFDSLTLLTAAYGNPALSVRILRMAPFLTAHYRRVFDSF